MSPPLPLSLSNEPQHLPLDRQSRSPARIRDGPSTVQSQLAMIPPLIASKFDPYIITVHATPLHFTSLHSTPPHSTPAPPTQLIPTRTHAPKRMSSDGARPDPFDPVPILHPPGLNLHRNQRRPEQRRNEAAKSIRYGSERRKQRKLVDCVERERGIRSFRSPQFPTVKRRELNVFDIFFRWRNSHLR